MRYSIRSFVLIAFWFSIVATVAAGDTVARCGEGWLEIVDHYPVLHLKGTPYEMGYQHGALLKESVRENLNNVLNNNKVKSVQVAGVTLSPRWVIDILPAMQISYTPSWYQEELKGLAAGSGLALSEVQAANFLPELFHCSGFAVMNGATTDGTMYHGRILDYACDWHLQDHAVLIIEEPTDGIPFANVTFAGFIGSVTGMNAKHVSIGEMGGGGQGHWAGTPMAVLMREVLQQASTLDEAVSIFRNAQRTCEYYYVIADGNTNRALGIQATWDHLETIEPGKFHERLEKPVKDCVLLSAGGRYTELARRAAEDYGKLDADMARHLMDAPVAGRANLHNVLFAPASTKMWIANASSDGQQAASQPYHAFQLSELLQLHPAADTPEISLRSQ